MLQWLHAKNPTTPRETVLAIGQALIDFGHLKDLTAAKNKDPKTIRFNEDHPYRYFLN